MANEKNVYKPKAGWGFIPREMAEFHSDNVSQTIKSALQKADMQLNDIDIIAFSQGPGIPQCLRIGAVVARSLSLKYNKPLIGVHHGIGHIEISKLMTSSKDPVILLLSGGHTAVITFIDRRYRILGETLDITAGNALDMLARKMDLQTPGGSQIELLAKNGRWVDLPYSVKGMDVSFSGLVTESIKKYKQGIKPEDIAYSFQETCFAMLVEVTERAIAHTDKEEALLVGGVAANKRLQEMLKIMCEERGAKFFVVPQEYAGDCGINIAWTGILAYQKGYKTAIEDSRIKQKWRVDEVEW